MSDDYESSLYAEAHEALRDARQMLAEAEARAERAEAKLAMAAMAWDEGFTACEDAIGVQVCFDVPNPYREGEG